MKKFVINEAKERTSRKELVAILQKKYGEKFCKPKPAIDYGWQEYPDGIWVPFDKDEAIKIKGHPMFNYYPKNPDTQKSTIGITLKMNLPISWQNMGGTLNFMIQKQS